jgi:hypothetical protein
MNDPFTRASRVRDRHFHHVIAPGGFLDLQTTNAQLPGNNVHDLTRPERARRLTHTISQDLISISQRPIAKHPRMAHHRWQQHITGHLAGINQPQQIPQIVTVATAMSCWEYPDASRNISTAAPRSSRAKARRTGPVLHTHTAASGPCRLSAT